MPLEGCEKMTTVNNRADKVYVHYKKHYIRSWGFPKGRNVYGNGVKIVGSKRIEV
jgi:hypothetical protein